MAAEVTIEIRADMTAFRRDVKSALDAATAQARQFKSALDSSVGSVNTLRSAVGGLQSALGVLAGVGGILALKRVGEFALQSAFEVNRLRSSLTALTGSAAAASARFSELVAIAQKTPGLTTSLAAALDIQLRILNTAEATINKILPVIGRLNAISPLGDPRRFAQNLGQLVTQNFEVQDLRELVGQSPLAGELIKTVFGVNSAINGKAIRESARKLGIDTADELFTALAKAAENHPALKNVTESMGTQFEKLRDRLTVAIAPVGEQIAKTLLPVFEDLVKAVEKYGDKAARVFEENRGAIIAAGKELVQLGVEFARFAGQIASSPQFRELFNLIGTDAARLRDAANTTGSERVKILLGISKGPQQLAAEERRRITLPSGETVFEQEARLLKEAEEMRKRLEGGGRDKSKDRSSAAGDASARSRKLSDLEQAIKDTEKLAKAVEALTKREGKLFEEEVALAVLRAQKEEFEKQRANLGFVEALKVLGKPLPVQLPGGIGLPRLSLTAIGAPAIAGLPSVTTPEDRAALAGDAAVRGQDLLNQRLRIRETQFSNQVTRGLLSEVEARQALNAERAASRDQLIALLEAEQQSVGVNSLRGLQIAEEIEQLQLLGVELSSTERFMRGFNSQVETVGDSFERFGQNVSRAFANVRDLFNGLKRAVLDFFNDLLGNALQNLVRGTLGQLFNGIGGSLGNLFRTPSFAGGGGGGGISAPPSITSVASSIPGLGGILRGLGGGGSSATTSAASAAGGGGFSFGGLGQSFAAAAPLLGLSLGAGLGGQSIGGQILGGIGGVLAGSAKSLIGLGSIAGIAGLVAAPLLIGGAILLGKAKQRRSDEEASGQFLTQALQGIDQLAGAVSSGQITTLGEARSVFESQVLGQFIQGIGGLKTKSVRESRLTNQVRDLRNVFESRIPPLISEQERLRAEAQRNAITHSRLVPEFATGGTSFGGLAFLHPGEKILNAQQQAAVRSMAGPGVFERAGVPGPSANRNFDIGGTMPAPQPLNITFDAVVVVSERTAEGIYVLGARSSSGQRINVDQVKRARLDGEL